MSAGAVLHVASPLGGGVDRHIRDIARGCRGRHLLWHAGEAAEVIEVIEPAPPRRFFALDPARVAAHAQALATWLRAMGVAIVHAHSMAAAPRARAAWAADALGTPTVATLHDILFMRPDALDPRAPAAPDADWLAHTTRFLAAAAARIAPSEYLARLARTHLAGLEILVVPNGCPARGAPAPRAARPQFEERRPARVVVVLGAIGPHKGARVLEEAAEALAPSGVGIVLVGYLDAQCLPGWRNAGLFVHGAYNDDEVAAWVAAYGGELALFPNRVAESFSYALSDLWQAGVPVLVPPEGALGERVRRHGGGWLLPPGFGAAEVAAEVRRILGADGGRELARVKSQLSRPDPQRVPALEPMTSSLDALYERFGLRSDMPVDPHSAPAQELLATHIDGSLFRPELARIADEVVHLRRIAAEERAAAARHAADAAQAREWIAKLERDVASLQHDLAGEVAERRRLGEENAQLAIHKAAFDLLPLLLRKVLLKKILNARS